MRSTDMGQGMSSPASLRKVIKGPSAELIAAGRLFTQAHASPASEKWVEKNNQLVVQHDALLALLCSDCSK